MAVVIACEFCGDTFPRKNARQRFCSVACRDQQMERWVERTCVQCQKPFHIHPWEENRPDRANNYCTRECYWESRVGKPRPGHHYDPEERTCLACGRVFLVGGRGRPPKRAVLCSLACQQAARYRHGTAAKSLSIQDAAYIAGIVDGEGSIMVIGRGVGASIGIRLAVANTFAPILDWLADVTGVGAVVWRAFDPESHHKRGGTWVCNSDTAESVLKQIRPYLQIKAEQADLALQFQERLRMPALKADRTWQEEWRQKMKFMNARGASGG